MKTAIATLLACLAALLAPAASAQPASAPNVQDLWWAGPQESGWGASIVQHGERLFVVLYVYNDDAHTTWFVVPGGTWNEARTSFTGAAYHPRGSYFARYEPAAFVPGEPVGQVRLDFDGPDRATLAYTLRGIPGSKSIVRQPFGPVATAPRTGLTDMWWGGPGQNGWGVAVVQQHAALFTIIFTYDRLGVPAWWVFPDGAWIDGSTFAGRVYRPVGARWLDVPFLPQLLRAPELGSFALTFHDDRNATLALTILGEGVVLPLARQPF